MRTLLVAALSLPLGGCIMDNVCSLIGGADGLSIGVEWAGGEPMGTYVVVGRADGVEHSATITTMGNAYMCTTSCSETVEAGDERVAFSLGTYSNIIGYADEGHGGPAVIELEILRDGATVAQGTYMPEYEWSYPNGRDCSPQVRNAHETLVVAAP